MLILQLKRQRVMMGNSICFFCHMFLFPFLQKNENRLRDTAMHHLMSEYVLLRTLILGIYVPFAICNSGT